MKKEEIVRPPLFNVHIDYFNGGVWDIPVSGPSEAREVSEIYAKMDDTMNVYWHPIGYQNHIWSFTWHKKFRRGDK